MTQKGQAILILILVMTVALTIGLSIVQKSLVDVSTSSKVEQSSRAFSAAEAGIEKALLESTTSTHGTPTFNDNSSKVESILDTGLLPPIPADNSIQPPLEPPALNILQKEGIAQVWLADYNSTDNPPPAYYNQPTLNIFWGNSSTDKPALELTLVWWDDVGNLYKSKKWYLDPQARSTLTGFTTVSCTGDADSNNKPTGGLRTYQCKQQLVLTPNPAPANWWPILLRARILYTASQPIAVQTTANGSCDGCNIPPQSRVIVSTGVAGETQRKVLYSQQSKVIPPFFDYAVFSVGTVGK